MLLHQTQGLKNGTYFQTPECSDFFFFFILKKNTFYSKTGKTLKCHHPISILLPTSYGIYVKGCGFSCWGTTKMLHIHVNHDLLRCYMTSWGHPRGIPQIRPKFSWTVISMVHIHSCHQPGEAFHRMEGSQWIGDWTTALKYNTFRSGFVVSCSDAQNCSKWEKTGYGKSISCLAKGIFSFAQIQRIWIFYDLSKVSASKMT